MFEYENLELDASLSKIDNIFYTNVTYNNQNLVIQTPTLKIQDFMFDPETKRFMIVCKSINESTNARAFTDFIQNTDSHIFHKIMNSDLTSKYFGVITQETKSFIIENYHYHSIADGLIFLFLDGSHDNILTKFINNNVSVTEPLSKLTKDTIFEATIVLPSIVIQNKKIFPLWIVRDFVWL